MRLCHAPDQNNHLIKAGVVKQSWLQILCALHIYSAQKKKIFFFWIRFSAHEAIKIRDTIFCLYFMWNVCILIYSDSLKDVWGFLYHCRWILRCKVWEKRRNCNRASWHTPSFHNTADLQWKDRQPGDFSSLTNKTQDDMIFQTELLNHSIEERREISM